MRVAPVERVGTVGLFALDKFQVEQAWAVGIFVQHPRRELGGGIQESERHNNASERLLRRLQKGLCYIQWNIEPLLQTPDARQAVYEDVSMPTNATLYEQDFYLWCLETCAALGAREFDAVDMHHLIEEIRDLGNNLRRALESDLNIVMLHLLKWEYQPERRQDSRRWEYSIIEHRQRIDRLLKKNPSLKPHLTTAVAEEYPGARRLAAVETDLPRATFPEACPWTVAQMLDHDFFPAL